MTRKHSFATLLILGALPFGAIAAEQSQPTAQSPATKSTPSAPAAKKEPAPLFEQLDSNHDSYVTQEEAKRSAEVTARYKELDADHDGRISAAEFKIGMQAKF
jgi:hypothetical protein